ncbi:MAG: nicotinate (nicotinamide) nucleotide adenylyltransferase [Blastocatellia bacterium]|nr:nicotinate (nicotinamide) nucleotide adenylyltransferase [Blastocatellia bacterium]
MARAVAANFKLDRLLLIPAARPPHKRTDAISDVYHRYAMAVLATMHDPRLFVSTIEMEAPERPYTFETIERLKAAYGPQTRLFLIIGADSFEEIHTWREPARLFDETDVIVTARPGCEITAPRLPAGCRSKIVDLRGRESAMDDAEGDFRRSVYLTDYVKRDISSTDIRRRAREGRTIGGLVPPEVAVYIEKYEIYRR